MISAMPKMPMASTAKSMPSARNGRPKVMRSSPVSRSVPTVESSTPDQDHGHRPEDRAARQHHREDEAHDHQREILCRAEHQGEARERSAERRDDEGRHRAGEERADGRDAERHAGAALAGHLVAVERGDHGGRLAGNVDQDRRGRAAVLGAVIDAGQHDQRAGGIEPEGDRQQHGDGGDRADAGQHADQRADEAAQEGEAEVLQRQGDAEKPRLRLETRSPIRSSRCDQPHRLGPSSACGDWKGRR